VGGRARCVRAPSRPAPAAHTAATAAHTDSSVAHTNATAAHTDSSAAHTAATAAHTDSSAAHTNASAAHTAGYLVGGEGQDETVFVLSMAFDGEAFAARWARAAPAAPPGGARAAFFPALSGSGMLFAGKLFFLARDEPASGPGAAPSRVVALDDAARGAALAWEELALSAGALPGAPRAQAPPPPSLPY
jgi:hypothetical protein